MLVAACSSSSSATIAHPFDACSALELDAPGASDAELASIDEAIALWQAVDLTAPSRTAAADAPAVTIVFEPGSPAWYGYFDDVAGAIYINTELSDDRRAITLAHELGHAFGLVHVPPAQRASVMNAGNLTVVPTDDDHTAIEAIWGSCADTPAS